MNDKLVRLHSSEVSHELYSPILRPAAHSYTTIIPWSELKKGAAVAATDPVAAPTTATWPPSLKVLGAPDSGLPTLAPRPCLLPASGFLLTGWFLLQGCRGLGWEGLVQAEGEGPNKLGLES